VHVLFVIGTQLLLSFSAKSSIYQLSVRATSTARSMLWQRSLPDQMIDLTLADVVEHQTCSMSSPARQGPIIFIRKMSATEPVI